VIAISCSSFVNAVGLPPIRPFFLATSRPALTLSFIKSRSNSASDPKILNINLPVLVVVSIDSVIDLKPVGKHGNEDMIGKYVKNQGQQYEKLHEAHQLSLF
jgi:hypothetical protein